MSNKAEIFNFFPKTFFKKNLEIDNKQIKKVISKLKYTTGDEISNNTASSIDRNIFDNLPQLKKLKTTIENEFKRFKDEVMLWKTNDFMITTSWSTRSKPKQESHKHRHKNCVYSGVYYLDAPVNSGNIKFYNPNETDILIIPSVYTETNSSSLTLKIKEGDVIFFPSEIPHSITVNKSKQTRYSIAFNLFPTGTLGKGDSTLSFSKYVSI